MKLGNIWIVFRKEFLDVLRLAIDIDGLGRLLLHPVGEFEALDTRLEASLGRVKGHPIFMITPEPELLCRLSLVPCCSILTP